MPRALFRSALEQRRQDLDQEVAASSRRERVKAVAQDGGEIETTGDVEPSPATAVLPRVPKGSKTVAVSLSLTEAGLGALSYSDISAVRCYVDVASPHG